MKALGWRRSIMLALPLAAAMSAAPAGANPQPALAMPALAMPAGLPGLPSLGEAMGRDPASGLALNGFDPVAYQVQGRAVAGRANHQLLLRGIAWRFASEANLKAFAEAPGAYEPAFSGFDPVGVAEGRAVEADAMVFAVVGTRLFLFRTQENRDTFLRDASLLRQAEATWPEVGRQIAR